MDLAFGTFGVVGALGQQVDQSAWNVIRNEAMRNAVARALSVPSLPPASPRQSLFFKAPDTLTSQAVCVIPLEKAHETPTNDKIVGVNPSPIIDSAMAKAIGMPACKGGFGDRRLK